jgi:hypothetical protein
MTKIAIARFMRHIATVTAVIGVVLLLASIANACPTCKSGLEDEAAGGDLIKGYFWSIIFMMSTPFAILGCFSGLLYREVRKARRLRETEAPESDQPAEG